MEISNNQPTRKILQLDKTEPQKPSSENNDSKFKKSSTLQDDLVTIETNGAHPTRPKKLSLEYDLASIKSGGSHPTRPKLSESDQLLNEGGGHPSRPKLTESQQLFDNGGGHPDRPKK